MLFDTGTPLGDNLVAIDGRLGKVCPGSTHGVAVLVSSLKRQEAAALTTVGPPPIVLISRYHFGRDRGLLTDADRNQSTCCGDFHIHNLITMLRACLTGALLLAAGFGSANGMHRQQSGADFTVAGHLYVQFTDVDIVPRGGKTGNDTFDRRAARYSVTAVEKAFPSLEVIAAHRPLSAAAEALRRVYLIRYASPHLPSQVAADLQGAPGVGFVESVYKKELFGPVSRDRASRVIPNDSLYSEQIHLPHLQLPEAWDEVKGADSTAVIAIVDGGTEWRHADLAANVWTNPNETADNGIDDDNNGFVDDIHGWNFSSDTADPTGPAGSQTGLHGTAVAGTAAAVTDNGIGIAGSSWNAQFMAVNASCQDQQSLCYAEHGILYAAFNGADVINASFGAPVETATGALAVQTAVDEGVLIVAASGNQGVDVDVMPNYPSSYPQTLSVGGTEKNTDYNIFNYGMSVNVFAPGWSIEVTNTNDDYARASGTSFSAPLVTGIAALVKTAFPSWSAERVREQIRLTAENIDGANPVQFAGKFGSGRVNAKEAVTASALPGIRVSDWSYQNQNGSTQVKSGDQVNVRITFTNYHGSGTALDAELTTGADYLQWSTRKVSLGSMTTGETRDVTFAFTIGANAPNNRTVHFIPKITAASFEDKSDVLRMAINETGVAAHATAALSVSITEEGNIGHTSFQAAPNSRGVGFAATTAGGTQRDLLFEGGLLIATSASQVSDCVRENETVFHDQQEDFVLKTGESLEVIIPGERTSEQSRVVLEDSRAADPIGVEVLQENFIDDTGMNEDFILLQYTVTNNSASEVQNLHVGLFFDWDVASGAADVTAFDGARQLGYVMDDAANPTAVVGTLLLTAHTLHYSAIDNAATIYRGQGHDGFTPAEKWTILSGGVRNNGVVSGPAADVSQLTAAGPFTLQPAASVMVAFAVVSGTSESDFLSNADNAQDLWDAISTNTDDETRPLAGWEIHTPYPHPSAFPMDIHFDTGAYGSVQLDVFDVLGRRVRRILDAQRPGGLHVVTWDGRDDAGTRVASGMYMVRMRALSGKRLHMQSRPILVVR